MQPGCGKANVGCQSRAKSFLKALLGAGRSVMEWSSSSSSQTGTDRYCGCSFELHSPRLARCDAAHNRVHYMCDV